MKRDALVVGINNYPVLGDKPNNPAKHLKQSADDAEAIAQILEEYGEFQVRRLPKVNQDGKLRVNSTNYNFNSLVKENQLKQAITELFHPKGGQIPETALLFFAGHGLRRKLDDATEGYLATSDSNPRRDKWGVSLHWLRKLLQDSPVRQQIIWLDCCHSGELFNFAEADLYEYEKGIDRCFIAASRDYQPAYEQAQGKHGVLTNALLQGLNPTLQQKKWVTNISLVNFVKEKLEKAPQHPVFNKPCGQIILTSTQPSIFDVCPYKGLAFFDFNDEDPKYFYGRETLINQLIDKVRENNFLAVLGASGSGKSSAVRAGLLHRLRLGEILSGSDRWKIYQPFTPGEHPLKSLEQVVGVKPDQLQALVKATPTDRVLLVVDQFEEVFTLCRDKTEREQFFKCLLDALKQLGNKLCLVLAMRADFQGKCSEHEYGGLAAKIDQNLVRVMPMTQYELKQAIIEPGKKVGLEIDRELVNQMIEDVFGSPGDLPLMQYTLTELWEKRTLGRLTINEYTRLGGVKEALKKRANQIYYKSLSSEEQLIAKQIFLELTHLQEETEEEYTRRQVRKEDLVTQGRSPELVEKVLQHLVEEKLVVTGEQEFEGERFAVVNIAHEALIRNWDLLGNWLKENREALLRKQDIEEAAKDWRENRNRGGEAYLLQGTRLAAAEDYLQRYAETFPLTGLAQEFVQRSIKQRQKNYLIRFGLGMVSLIGVVFAGFQYTELKKQNQINRDGKLIRKAKNLKSQGVDFWQTSLLLATESMKRLPSSEATKFLQHELTLLPKSINTIKSNESNRSTTISPNGKYLASIIGNNKIRVSEISTGRKVALLKSKTSVKEVIFNSEENYIVAVSDNNDIQSWEIASGRVVIDNQLGTYKFNGKSEITIIFSPDSKYLAAYNNDNIFIWDIASGREWSKFPIESGRIKFSPDSKYLAASNNDNTFIWDVASGRELSKIPIESGIINFSADSKYLVEYTSTNGFLIWTVNNGKRIAHFHPESSGSLSTVFMGANFSQDGKYLHTSSYTSRSYIIVEQLWSLDKNLQEIKEIELPMTNGYNKIAHSSNGNYLATVDLWERKIVQLWKDPSHREVAKIAHDEEVDELIFSPKEKYLASIGDGSIRIFESATGTEVLKITQNIDKKCKNTYKKCNLEIFSPDERYLVTVGQSISQAWEIASKKEIARFINPEEISEVKFTPDSNYLTFIDSNGNTQIWDYNRRWRNLRSSLEHKGLVSDVTFSPDSKYLCTASEDETVRLWDVTTGKNILSLKVEVGRYDRAYGSSAKACVFTSDGKYLVTLNPGANRSFQIWETTSGNNVANIHDSFSYSESAKITSEDGRYFTTITKSNNNKLELEKIQFWETASGREVFSLSKDQTSLSQKNLKKNISPDNKFLAILSDENTINIQKANSNQTLIQLAHQSKVNDIAFSSNGKYIASASSDGTVELLRLLDSEQLISQVCNHLTSNLSRDEWSEYFGNEPYRKTCPNLP